VVINEKSEGTPDWQTQLGKVVVMNDEVKQAGRGEILKLVLGCGLVLVGLVVFLAFLVWITWPTAVTN